MKAFWTLPFFIWIAYAQVELKVVATDHAGHPVTDLQPADLKVIYDGSPQSITSLRLDQSKTVPTIVILLDLLDLSFQERNAEVNQMRESLAGAEATSRLHLYLLTVDGGLYPVQGIGKQLDQALQKVKWSAARGPQDRPSRAFQDSLFRPGFVEPRVGAVSGSQAVALDHLRDSEQYENG
jgi:hypothetical protein